MPMQDPVSLITAGIRVQVRATYKEGESVPQRHYYAFAYEITIENLGEEPVQLLSRSWYITDGHGQQREVHGEGVVGVQPVIAPGERYRYTSWCPFQTPIGRMHGAYQMLRLQSGQHFDAKIPHFILSAPFLHN